MITKGQGQQKKKLINKKKDNNTGIEDNVMMSLLKLAWQRLAHHIKNFNVKTLTFC